MPPTSLSPLYLPSLLPIFVAAGALAALSWRGGRPGLAAYNLSLIAWAASLLLSAHPDTRPFGERLLMLGFFVAAGFNHAVAEDQSWRTPAVPGLYVGAAVMTALGALPQGLFLREGGTVAGPYWTPMFGLATWASALPILYLLDRIRLTTDRGERQRLAYLTLSGFLGTVSGGVNVLLTMTGRHDPLGLYGVLLSLALLSYVVTTPKLPKLGHVVEASLRYSAMAALLSTLFMALVLLGLRAGAGGALWSWRALFLGFLILLTAQPALSWARARLAASLFAGRQDVHGLTEALVKSEARAEHSARLAELGTLAAAVAHEVRNPLGVISACATVLERQGADPDTVAELRAQVDRAARFAEELLEVGRPSPLTLRPIGLHDAAEVAASEVRRALGLPLELQVEGAQEVRGDHAQLVRLLSALLENAVLAGAKTARVRLQAEGAQAVLDLEDDGPGVPEALAATLFEPFVSGRSRSSPRPGTGLGLAIARGAAERHRGALTLEGRSEALGGAWFRLRLPFDPEAR
ncbi:HAMP domain-containing histidine kinase [Myxococcota bacterium]|nr:HAMP domain-containing histidine kinase [Myxococcota bacterium]